jgi:glycosyltransferase involved in cell wall biosynthesis
MLTAVKRQNEDEARPRGGSRDVTHDAGALMPVVFVVTQSGRQANGGVESITAVLERLRGVKATVVTQTETPANVCWQNAGCKVQLWKTAEEALKIRSALRTNLRMFRLLRSSGCRVVHCNDISAVWNTAFGARLAGAAVIFNVRNIKPEGKRYGWRWWVARKISSRQLLLSREMQDAFVSRLNLKNGEGGNGEVEFIYSAVDPVRFSPIDGPRRSKLRQRFGIDADCFAIGYIAPFGERKAQLEFIKEAGPLLKRMLPRARVYFVGDFAPEHDDYASGCRQAARHLDIQDSMAFIGFTREVAEWYRALDLVVVASRNEGLARCMIESLACGTPVVSFEVCSAREILEEHGCGLVVANRNYPKLVEQIATLAREREMRAQFAKSGVALVGQLFDPETVAAKYEQLYFSLNKN